MNHFACVAWTIARLFQENKSVLVDAIHEHGDVAAAALRVQADRTIHWLHGPGYRHRHQGDDFDSKCSLCFG